MKNIRLFSYILTDDDGFAPNPFWGVCTFTCCKPKIREYAQVGDWIVGIRGKMLFDLVKRNELRERGSIVKTGRNKDININKIIFSMEVNEKIEFDEYFKKYPKKYPVEKPQDKSKIYKVGDNIYQLNENDKYMFVGLNIHNDKKENRHDLSTKFVLISSNFFYFGSEPIDIPDFLDTIIKKGPGHKCIDDIDTINLFLKYIKKYKKGVNARPSIWCDDDPSWKL